MTKLFIATPAYLNMVFAEYCHSLCHTVCQLQVEQIEVQLFLKMSGSILPLERNKIIEAFMKSDCTHLLCIDSDVAWQPTAVKKLLTYNEDFVCGVYPTRNADKEFIVRLLLNDQGCLVYKGDLIEVESVGAGFMLIRRNVIEGMIANFPDLMFYGEEESNPVRYAFFNTIVKDQKFWGEDFTFCFRARDAGFKIYIDPSLNFNHAGIIGCVQDALKEHGYLDKPATEM